MSRRISIAAIGAALLLTACGTGSGDPQPGANPATDGADAPGGTLVYATGDAEPTCLDPHVGGNYPQALISAQYLEPLVGRDAEGTIQPWLATEWEVAEDGLTWDFTLQEGITFTDGTPLDAEAVRVNIEHLQDPETASSTGYLAVEKIDEVEPVDETHVRFHLSEPDSSLLESLSQQWTAIQSPTGIERGMDENCAEPIGTGPFVVVDWVPQQHVLLERNEDYATPGPEAEHEGPALLEAIEWRFIPDPATRSAALTSGEVHVIDNPEPDAIATAGEDIEHIDAPRPGSVNRIELNAGQPPFDDVRVREAFVRAADIGPGIDTLYKGVAERSYSPLSSVEPFAYSDDSLFTPDPEKASALLDEAGWSETDAEGYRVKDGERLTVRFPVSTNQSVAAERALFEQIQAQAKDAGFEVILTPLDLSAWYEALEAPADAGADDSAEYTYEAVSAPYTKVGPDVLRILYHSDGIEPAPSGYFANHAQVDDPEVDELLEQAARDTDVDARQQTYEDVQRQILQGYYILPLYDQQNHFLTRGVTGVDTLGTVATPTFINASLAE